MKAFFHVHRRSLYRYVLHTNVLKPASLLPGENNYSLAHVFCNLTPTFATTSKTCSIKAKSGSVAPTYTGTKFEQQGQDHVVGPDLGHYLPAMPQQIAQRIPMLVFTASNAFSLRW